MPISRRTLIRRLGMGGAVAATSPHLRVATISAAGADAPGETNGRGPIRLNRNENAYGPSRNVIEVMRETALTAASRYPDIEAEALRRTIAGSHRVAPEQVALGCGSSELLRVAIDLFAG